MTNTDNPSEQQILTNAVRDNWTSLRRDAVFKKYSIGPTAVEVSKKLKDVQLVLSCSLKQWFLTLLKVLNPESFISAWAEPFVIEK